MNNNKWKIWILIAVVIVVLGTLFMWPKLNNLDKETTNKWLTYGIDCLRMSHTNSTQHIHSNLEIFIDDKQQIIPAEIGIVKSCMAEVHTHDTSGKIHIESVLAGKEFTLKQFFDIWGEKLEKEGYNLEINSENIILKDNQKIVLKYTKNPQ